MSSLINIIYFTSCCTTTFRSRFLGRTSIKLGFIFKSKLISIIDLIWVLEAHLILDGQSETIDIVNDFLVFSFNQVASLCQLMELFCILLHRLVILPQILHPLIQCLLIALRQKLCFLPIFHLAPISEFSFTPHFSIILIIFPPSRSCFSQLKLQQA